MEDNHEFKSYIRDISDQTLATAMVSIDFDHLYQNNPRSACYRVLDLVGIFPREENIEKIETIWQYNQANIKRKYEIIAQKRAVEMQLKAAEKIFKQENLQESTTRAYTCYHSPKAPKPEKASTHRKTKVLPRRMDDFVSDCVERQLPKLLADVDGVSARIDDMLSLSDRDSSDAVTKIGQVRTSLGAVVHECDVVSKCVDKYERHGRKCSANNLARLHAQRHDIFRRVDACFVRLDQAEKAIFANVHSS